MAVYCKVKKCIYNNCDGECALNNVSMRSSENDGAPICNEYKPRIKSTGGVGSAMVQQMIANYERQRF